MEKQDKSLIFNYLLKYASIIAILVIANSYILYLNGINEYTNTNPKFIYNLKVIIIGTGIYLGLNNLSYRVLKVKFSFGKYILYGFIMGLLYAVLTSFYFVVYVKKWAPETIDYYTSIYDTMQIPKSMNIDPGYIKELAKQMLQSPVILFFSNFFGEVISFVLYSLLFAIFYVIFPMPKNIK